MYNMFCLCMFHPPHFWGQSYYALLENMMSNAWALCQYIETCGNHATIALSFKTCHSSKMLSCHFYMCCSLHLNWPFYVRFSYSLSHISIEFNISFTYLHHVLWIFLTCKELSYYPSLHFINLRVTNITYIIWASIFGLYSCFVKFLFIYVTDSGLVEFAYWPLVVHCVWDLMCEFFCHIYLVPSCTFKSLEYHICYRKTCLC